MFCNRRYKYQVLICININDTDILLSVYMQLCVQNVQQSLRLLQFLMSERLQKYSALTCSHLTDCMAVVNYQLALIMSRITCCVYPLEGKWHAFNFQPLFFNIFCNHTTHPCVMTVFQEIFRSPYNSYWLLQRNFIDGQNHSVDCSIPIFKP